MLESFLTIDPNLFVTQWHPCISAHIFPILESCLDRHVEADPDRVAFIWEKDEPNQHENITYR